MSDPLHTTLALLAKTENEAAVNVLIPALDHPRPEISSGALTALLDRRSRLGQQEILRRLHISGEPWRAIIEEKRGRLNYAIRDGILGKDPQMCANACQAIVWFREYEQLPALITALEDEHNPSANLAAQTVKQVADLLFEELAGPRDYRDRRDPQLIRRNAVAALEVSAQRVNRHQHIEVVEAFLSLTSRDNVVLKQILLDPHHAGYLHVIRVLRESRAPGVIRLLLSFLDETNPPSAALTTLFRREDPELVHQLLKKIGDGHAPLPLRHLKRVEQIPWADPQQDRLTQLDGSEQNAAVKLLMASGVDRQTVFENLKQLLDHGQSSGRQGAVESLGQFPQAEVNGLLLKGC